MENLNITTLKLIAKLASDALDGRRGELGLVQAEFEVDETIVLHVEGAIRVAKSTQDGLCPQSVKPWDLVTTLLTELNKERAAAGKIGIDIAKVVELAEKVDPDLAKKAQEEATLKVRALKEPTRKFKWGGISVHGTAKVIATNRADDDAQEAAE